MLDRETIVDFSVIDDLVCGNLRGEDYCRALRALDAEPKRWRDCAIAFLQEQALSQDLRTLAQLDLTWGDSDADAEHEPESSNVEESTPVKGQTTVETSHHMHFSKLQWMHRLTNLAALLLISFTIGWFGAGLQREYQQTSGNRVANSIEGKVVGREAEQPAAIHQLTQNALPAAASLSPDEGLFLSGDDLGLADASLMPIDRDMPDWLRRYERAGRVKIDSYEALMPMEFADGTSALVPVQQYRVKPVVYSY